MRRTATLFIVTLLSAVAVACSSKSDGSDPSPGGGPDDDGGHNNQTPGTHFEPTSTDYGLPTAGWRLSGFFETSNTSFEEVGDEYWTLADMDGDKYPDLVVTTVIRQVTGDTADDIYDEVYEYSTTPDWHVYRGGPNGFDQNFIKWSVPQGGRKDRGFNRISLQGGADRIHDSPNSRPSKAIWRGRSVTWMATASPIWWFTGVAELLVQVGFVVKVLGGNNDPHWNVYKNTGTGFASEPTKWSVPSTPVWTISPASPSKASNVVQDYKKQLSVRDRHERRQSGPTWWPTPSSREERQQRLPRAARGPALRPPLERVPERWKQLLPTSTPWHLPRQIGQGDEGPQPHLWLRHRGERQLLGAVRPHRRWKAGSGGDFLPEGQTRRISFNYPSDAHWQVYANTQRLRHEDRVGRPARGHGRRRNSTSGSKAATPRCPATRSGRPRTSTATPPDLIETGEYHSDLSAATTTWVGRRQPALEGVSQPRHAFDAQGKDWALRKAAYATRFVWTFDGYGPQKKIDDDM